MSGNGACAHFFFHMMPCSLVSEVNAIAIAIRCFICWFSFLIIYQFFGFRTDCVFSPNDRLLMTGTSFQKGESGGKLVFFDRQTFNRVYDIEVAKTHVVRALWHPKLNQIAVGGGDGKVKLFFDAEQSNRGAKLCIAKPKKRVRQVCLLILFQFLILYVLLNIYYNLCN